MKNQIQLLTNIFSGQPTKVEFHVTVMSLDSINEGSMVSHFYKIIAMMTMILGLIKIIMKSLISLDSGRIPILADIIYGRKIEKTTDRILIIQS